MQGNASHHLGWVANPHMHYNASSLASKHNNASTVGADPALGAFDAAELLTVKRSAAERPEPSLGAHQRWD
jgi:hypothetical protein